MLSVPTFLFGLLASSGAASAFDLYAYGTNIGGLRVFFFEQTAYIGVNQQGSARNVSFSSPTASTTLPCNMSATSSPNYLLALDETPTAFSPLTFAPLNTDAAATKIKQRDTFATQTAGWGFYGSTLFHLNSNTSAIETNFWAIPADEDAAGTTTLYTVNWKGDQAATSQSSGSVQIGLRTTPPS